MTTLVTVAIPALNAGPEFERTLAAVNEQRVDGDIELLVCDSGSTDRTLELSRRHGASVLEIRPRDFGHGRSRNLLMECSHGSHVAFLTQDAVPADEDWLSRLLGGFQLAPDVALSFGPYRPRADASPMLSRELSDWFGGLSVAGQQRLDRLAPAERSLSPRALLGPRGFFTDANGCVARDAWEQVPFRDVSYAEDQRLAADMLRAGFAKVFVPDAAVVHSHDYSALGWLRRSFDEARGLREVYGWAEPVRPRTLTLNLWGRVGADLRWVRSGRPEALSRREMISLLTRSTVHHAARATGTVLGGRAERLSPRLAERLSLEGRRR